MTKPRAKPGGATGGGSGDKYYILASSPAADDRGLVLKEGETFAVFDHYGDVRPSGLGEEGIFHCGTRYLSCLILALEQVRPLFLSSTVRQDNALVTVDLTNPDLSRSGQVVVPRGTVHLARTKFLRAGAAYERLHLRNYGLVPVNLTLALHFEADFADLFEVRGTRRTRRGHDLGAEVLPNGVTLGYTGLDGVTRHTHLLFSRPPTETEHSGACFRLNLAAHAEESIELTILCEQSDAKASPLSFATALTEASQPSEKQRPCLRALNGQVNAWTERSAADLSMMTTQTPYGPYPFAGVPWFSCPFGRDGIITALECLWLRPEVSRGVLAFLAATQASAVDPARDAEPGKILHEMRNGEMAALGEIPFARYYGSVDATPLYVLLADAYYQRTGDRAFIESIWPNIEAALHWIDTDGDKDGDGFVEYARQSSTGLVQQGWKDSHDSIFHADGTLAQPPIALCEVQAYVYAARRGAAELAGILGMEARDEELSRQAATLRERFEEAFWCADIGTYALALDGNKKPCRVRTSNAGHALFTGIADRARANQAATTLLAPASFSGWGVRTVAEGEARYNPMSYHNGSVWPHDNALVAQGLAHYGLKDGVLKILRGLFEASVFVDLHRLPELFCGFAKRSGEGPTLYPVACSPQAWSSATPFLLLQACLGLDVRGPERQICFHQPVLPPFLPQLRIERLDVGGTEVDLLLRRHGDEVSITVPRRHGTVEVRVVK